MMNETPNTAFLDSPTLKMAADVVDDLERVRNANQNRLRQMTRVGPDKDGKHRGFGLDKLHPDVLNLARLVGKLDENYQEAVKNLERAVRAHPLWPWAEQIKGLGAKQFARLLGTIGDPYWNVAENRPRRGPAELWAYTGYHVVNGVVPRRKTGVQTAWNETARMRVWLISEKLMMTVPQPERDIITNGVPRHYAAMAGSPYRALYDAQREKYADAKHDYPCVQCGTGRKPTEGVTRGTPAEPGTPLRDGHKHGRALHKVGQVFLRDLWRESKRLHELQAAAKAQATPTGNAPLPASTSGDG